MIAVYDEHLTIEGAEHYLAGGRSSLNSCCTSSSRVRIQDKGTRFGSSRKSGLPRGTVKNSVDMAGWDDEGQLLKKDDVQRIIAA